MNSKWVINRIGLLDFWYYDEEEFYFLDGRMLLRGANGSGKSVTMQSFIPLLLDGNMRPERLDPFGSRARKMDNYLLEENDPREERTGYLYMEFKRQDSDTYLTIGIGLRARKNKKLETWYFYISDGRRIGKDFFLYKEVQGKIAYTKQELKNRIGEGGMLIESQRDYMDYVNKLIFGFETIDEYKEMIELLIQLRTPKLSKDFKPSIINEILSSSLQPLSEDDLRPMTEAIENMDNLKTNLDNLNQSLEAAKRIERVYDRYNQYLLYDKANQYKEQYEVLQKLMDIAALQEQTIEETALENEREEQRLIALKQEDTVLKAEEESLNSSDAKTLKEREGQLIAELESQKEMLQEKNNSLQAKKEKRIEFEDSRKTRQDEADAIRSEIENYLELMDEQIADLSFDEHAFMAKDIKEHMEIMYSYDIHKTLVHRLSVAIEEGIDALKEEERVKRDYDKGMKRLEDTRMDHDRKEKEVLQYENQLVEVKNELIEKVYLWANKNRELVLPKELTQQIATSIDLFTVESDYSDIKDLVRAQKLNRENQLRVVLSNLISKQDAKNEEVEDKRKELEEWVNRKDPEPERSEAVKRNREVLREKGIPFYEFYKTLDFQKHLSKQQADILEEALASMGVLDALIVSAQDRDRILALDHGLCDRYIFTDVEHVKNSIYDLFDINNEDNDILFYHQITQVLMSIGYMEEDHTSIDANGNYRLGVIRGTITKDYKAKFIGVKAREEYRRERIETLTLELESLIGEQQMLQEEINQYQERLSILEEELGHFPEGIDLKTAIRDYVNAQEHLEKLSMEIKMHEENLQTIAKELFTLQDLVRTICARVYLSPRLDVFIGAKNNLAEYSKSLAEVQIGQSKYCNTLQSLQDIAEQIEGIDEDIDGFLYDITHMEQKRKQLSASLISVQEQLKLTNYDEIKERLDHCVMRLSQLPMEIEESIRKGTNLKNKLEAIKKEKEEKQVEILKARTKLEFLALVFQKEYNLGYVCMEHIDPDMYYKASTRIIQTWGGSFGNKKREDYAGDLQEVFHQNRGYLLEYHMNLQSLFDDLDGLKTYDNIYAKRLDIIAKYRGISVKFKELTGKLTEDIEEQTNLLNDQDRELFEDILANTISKKIRAKIYSSNAWVDKMNQLMGSMKTSSGLTLSLRWRSKSAEHEEQLDTRELVELLKKDAEIMKEEDFTKLSLHFRSKIREARKTLEQADKTLSFHGIMREILDYRKWFEFQLECRKTGENKKELTDRVFFTFSGGEKAMSMYVPLFSAVVAKYQGARKDAPRLISLDEAFAGVDETNINDMFRLMVEFDFEFIINSQILYGDYESVPSIAIYQLLRPENAKYVSVISYIWNGKNRELVIDMEDYVG
ncbi:MAG: TIGR02680 family protein [Clostridiales bacterium]|nr:TIGR02680 family protein [Clostridiales bacterium]